MSRAWILMTAMPPTKGHRNLIRFGGSLAREVHVIVCTQPGEPFTGQRAEAVRQIAREIHYSRVSVHHLHKELPQDPATPGFWEMWHRILTKGDDAMDQWFNNGIQPGDYFVSSEPYGARVAEMTGAIFMPYDPDRELFYTKATEIRVDPLTNFEDIAPEFQHHVRTGVTVFGAESTGKTTLSKALARDLNGHWFFEWARPYLETVGPTINIDSMTAIWRGQAATQSHSWDFYDKPFAIYDTDLYSTIGYWEQPHWQKDLGPVPPGLIADAKAFRSDLYIITKSNIPFEADPLRYGGDKRESPDEFWIGVAEKYGLNYVVLEETDLAERLRTSIKAARLTAQAVTSGLHYDRKGY